MWAGCVPVCVGGVSEGVGCVPVCVCVLCMCVCMHVCVCVCVCAFTVVLCQLSPAGV